MSDFDEENDTISEASLAAIERLYERLPQSWEITSTQAHARSVTATIRFDGMTGPMAQAQALDDVFAALQCFGALARNLRREREKKNNI